MLNIAIIGAGNIIKTRHLSALKKNASLFNVVGIIDVNGINSKKLALENNIPNFSSYKKYSDLRNIPWFKDVEAVIIAVPPLEHAEMIKQCLLTKKHVLVEKPFVTDLKIGKKLVELAKKNKLILAVVHNFQFSGSFLKLNKLLKTNELGKIKSFYCAQLTNNTRRIPEWADNLPLGLFYDETPHIFYLLRNFAKGKIDISNAYKSDSNNGTNTPKTLNVDALANGIPATIYINFESPISEWVFMVLGDKKIAIVDMFRDIIIVLPHDQEHLMKQVFKTSALTTYYHWKGFIQNGFKYIRHRLYYGMDIVHENFYDAVVNGNTDVLSNMSGEDGLEVNKIQWEVVKY